MENMPAALIPPVPTWSENLGFLVNDVAQRIAILCLMRPLDPGPHDPAYSHNMGQTRRSNYGSQEKNA